jgi:hypothetical protein
MVNECYKSGLEGEGLLRLPVLGFVAVVAKARIENKERLRVLRSP